MLNKKNFFSWLMAGFFAGFFLLALSGDESQAVACDANPIASLSDADTPSSESSEAEQATATDEETSPLFLRMSRDEDGAPLAMETSVVSYASNEGENEGLVVDLIGAVHIGDPSYYEELNTLFEEYDVLLYELVAEEDTRPSADDARSPSLIGMFQSGMGDFLELSHQIDCVDYSCENFVHADMSPEAFAEAMEERGESWLQAYFEGIGKTLAVQSSGQSTDFELLSALFAPNRAVRLKRIIASEFESSDALSLISSEESAIVTDRNTKALEVLTEQIGEGHKKIGIFYGAAHMPDFERRLDTEFGLHRTDERWLAAWDLTDD